MYNYIHMCVFHGFRRHYSILVLLKMKLLAFKPTFFEAAVFSLGLEDLRGVFQWQDSEEWTVLAKCP